MDTEDSPLISTGLPGCPYRMTSYTGTALSDADETYGLQVHHPRFLEFIGAPESARLLNHSQSFWVNRLGEECAMAAAVNLQRDAGLMMSNLQILAQFVTALHRMSSEIMSISCKRNSEVIHDSEGPASGQIHGSNGPVAPSVGSGCSWASVDIVLRILYEM